MVDLTFQGSLGGDGPFVLVDAVPDGEVIPKEHPLPSFQLGLPCVDLPCSKGLDRGIDLRPSHLRLDDDLGSASHDVPGIVEGIKAKTFHRLVGKKKVAGIEGTRLRESKDEVLGFPLRVVFHGEFQGDPAFLSRVVLVAEGADAVPLAVLLPEIEVCHPLHLQLAVGSAAVALGDADDADALPIFLGRKAILLQGGLSLFLKSFLLFLLLFLELQHLLLLGGVADHLGDVLLEDQAAAPELEALELSFVDHVTHHAGGNAHESCHFGDGDDVCKVIEVKPFLFVIVSHITSF